MSHDPAPQPLLKASRKRAGWKAWWRDTNGTAAIIFGVVAPVTIGMVGLGVDIASWYLTKRQLQVVSDTAAITGAHVANYKNSTSLAKTAAEQEVTDVTSTTRLAGVTATVQAPPAAGPFAGDNQAVSVELSYTHPFYFAGIVLSSKAVLISRSVAKRMDSGEYCVVALDPATEHSVEFAGNGNISLGCGVISNSNHPQSLYAHGQPNVTAEAVASGGDMEITGSAIIDSQSPLKTYAPPVADPYGPAGRNIQVPSPLGSCTSTGLVVTGTTTLTPGRYCGGLAFEGGANATLQPGTYYIDGNKFSVKGGSTVSGNGVTIVLTGSGTDYATMVVAGGTTLDLTAPAAGSGADYEGIVIYQDQNAPQLDGSGNQIVNKIVGGTDLALTGAVYIPNQVLEISGGTSGGTSCLQIVARRVVIAGGTALDNNCPANTGQDTVMDFDIKLVE